MKKFRKLFLSLLLTVTCLSPLSIDAADLPETAAPTVLSAGSVITPCADDIRYVYEARNGKLYRRKYNYTKGYWVGPWELVP